MSEMEPPDPTPAETPPGPDARFLRRTYAGAVLLTLVVTAALASHFPASVALGFLAAGAVSLLSFGSIHWLVMRAVTPGARRLPRWWVGIALVKYPLLAATVAGLALGIARGVFHPFAVAGGLLVVPVMLGLRLLGSRLGRHANLDRG